MINRTAYIDNLLKWKDKKIIKVLTGMRRVGKSTIFLLYKKYLLEHGVNESQIIYFNLEDLAYDYINTYKVLYNEVINKIKNDKMHYVIIDEIQNVEQFEKAIDSLFIKDNVDIYITGSNAKFLSSEIATILSGRYIEYNVLPLTFKEYISDELDSNRIELNNEIEKYKLFDKYLKYGAMPYVKSLKDNDDEIYKYLESIYNTVYAKDILSRVEIRNYDVLNKTATYLFDNISNHTSVKKITDTLKSAGADISQPTVDSYIDALASSYMFYKINRYDIKGKKILSTQFKYYAVDMGLRNYVLNITNKDIGRILENIVYIELKYRGYKLSIGNIGDYEIDFIAEKMGEKYYFQVAQSIMDENIYKREIRPLTLIKDNYPKYILTMDNVFSGNEYGIKCVNIIDFLLYN